MRLKKNKFTMIEAIGFTKDDLNQIQKLLLRVQGGILLNYHVPSHEVNKVIIFRIPEREFNQEDVENFISIMKDGISKARRYKGKGFFIIPGATVKKFGLKKREFDPKKNFTIVRPFEVIEKAKNNNLEEI